MQLYIKCSVQWQITSDDNITKAQLMWINYAVFLLFFFLSKREFHTAIHPKCLVKNTRQLFGTVFYLGKSELADAMLWHKRLSLNSENSFMWLW